jgi:integrase/recombinase XerD
VICVWPVLRSHLDPSSHFRLMFELCVEEPRALARHRAAPLAAERERFIAHLHKGGVDRVQLRTVAAYLRRFVTILPMQKLRDVSEEEVEGVARNWVSDRHRYSKRSPGPTSMPYFRWIVRKWLRFLGRMPEPPRRPQPFSQELADYKARMSGELGFAETTVYERGQRAANFLRWLGRKHRKFAKVCLRDVDDYLAESARTWNLITLSGECSCLRSFFYHAAHRGWCSAGIAAGIRGPALRRDIFEPQGPKWSDVLKLLRSIKGKTAIAVRAKALVLLYAVYGLRSSEAMRIRLSDIDWERNCFTVRRAKRGGLQQFPIQPEVGAAIRRYIDCARPNCECPEVFITWRKPFRPMRSRTIASFVARRMIGLGIQSKHHGPQSLRHSCATHLLAKGAHLQDIADFLGHRSCESVRTYAKFTRESLMAIVKVDLTAGL